MVPRIFRYVVRVDAGTAPRPFGSICSLAICKPKIRATASVGDWVLGFRSRRAGELIYAMEVTERLTLGEYWNEPRFRDRRPGASPYPDNFYRPVRSGLAQVKNDVHGPDAAMRDINGRYVLLSARFWYFGSTSPPVPDELAHLVYGGRGHVVRGSSPEDVEVLRAWLAAWPLGQQGQPIDDFAVRAGTRGASSTAGASSCDMRRGFHGSRLSPRGR